METNAALNEEVKLDIHPALAQIIEWRAQGMKIGFANGCFDIIHGGHVHMLNFARQNCDKLVVGVSADDIVRESKGADRPFLEAEDRAFILSGLSAVDLVVIIFDKTPERLIEKLMPDVVIKGTDYEGIDFPEKSLIGVQGGTILYAPKINSSSKIAGKINKALPKE